MSGMKRVKPANATRRYAPFVARLSREGSPSALLATVPRMGELDATFARPPRFGVPAIDGDEGLKSGILTGAFGMVSALGTSSFITTSSASDEGYGSGEDMVGAN